MLMLWKNNFRNMFFSMILSNQLEQKRTQKKQRKCNQRLCCTCICSCSYSLQFWLSGARETVALPPKNFSLSRVVVLHMQRNASKCHVIMLTFFFPLSYLDCLYQQQRHGKRHMKNDNQAIFLDLEKSMSKIL